jgi:hypothetical protein
MTNTAWRILLGEHWHRFTSAQPNLEMLGTVQRGAQIGALARRIDGSYVQLNGDHLGRSPTTWHRELRRTGPHTGSRTRARVRPAPLLNAVEP